jgi:hypothetical protein
MSWKLESENEERESELEFGEAGKETKREYLGCGVSW